MKLGRRYEYGEGGAEESLEKAIDYFKKGIKLECPRCMNELGYMYNQGEGMDTNAKLAFGSSIFDF